MNWWWIAAGWIACGGIAAGGTYSVFDAPWYARAGLFLSGPIGLGFVLYVMSQRSDI